jgi:SOS response regulatory protein OraA/RecX
LLKEKALKTEKNLFIKKSKIRNYLLQKGFENDLINEALHKIN